MYKFYHSHQIHVLCHLFDPPDPESVHGRLKCADGIDLTHDDVAAHPAEGAAAALANLEKCSRNILYLVY